jgi:hypothetical protein
MATSFASRTTGLLVTLGLSAALGACSREEPPPAPQPIPLNKPLPAGAAGGPKPPSVGQKAKPPGPQAQPPGPQAQPPGPQAQPVAPAAKPPLQATAPAAGAGQGAKAAGPTGGEPGALTTYAEVDEIVGDLPHAVQLDVDVLPNTGVGPFTYLWDFGDATAPSTEKAPKHTYMVPGEFRASVIVRDSKGEIDQDFVDITVNDAEHGPSPDAVREMAEKYPVEKLLEQAGRAGGATAGEASK